jgi:hypothetical protein
MGTGLSEMEKPGISVGRGFALEDDEAGLFDNDDGVWTAEGDEYDVVFDALRGGICRDGEGTVEVFFCAPKLGFASVCLMVR